MEERGRKGLVSCFRLLLLDRVANELGRIDWVSKLNGSIHRSSIILQEEEATATATSQQFIIIPGRKLKLIYLLMIDGDDAPMYRDVEIITTKLGEVTNGSNAATKDQGSGGRN